ncbi:MAG: DUF2442 domain-containing protein [Magnetococcales bacterium]|nr:DUF2442 domain-containing protein [Magnetococcales bacterium]
MTPRIVAVEVLQTPTLVLSFANGERRCFDVSPYLDKGIFQKLRDTVYFRSVRATSGFVTWPHGQDLSPDTLYLRSVPCSSFPCDGHEA